MALTRRNAVLLSVAAVVLAAVLFLYALSQTTLSYLVPSPEGIIRRTAIFRPALVASIVNGVALVASIGVLVWHVVSRPPRWVWWVSSTAVTTLVEREEVRRRTGQAGGHQH